MKLLRGLFASVPTEELLVSAIRLNPILRGDVNKASAWPSGISSFFLDNRHRRFFSLSGCSTCSVGVIGSSNRSKSEPSWEELCTDMGCDACAFSSWSEACGGRVPLDGICEARGVGSDGVSMASVFGSCKVCSDSLLDDSPILSMGFDASTLGDTPGE